MDIILYSNNCPKCRVLKTKLNLRNIDFKEESDITVIQELGIQSLPYLFVNNKLMDFSEANKWINEVIN